MGGGHFRQVVIRGVLSLLLAKFSIQGTLVYCCWVPKQNSQHFQRFSTIKRTSSKTSLPGRSSDDQGPSGWKNLHICSGWSWGFPGKTSEFFRQFRRQSASLSLSKPRFTKTPKKNVAFSILKCWFWWSKCLPQKFLVFDPNPKPGIPRDSMIPWHCFLNQPRPHDVLICYNVLWLII